ncbi:MAG: vWA domain-containing protein [Candidatus Acidiferrales bacterium]
MTGLRATDFKASLRGATAQITSFEPYTKPARIVLVIDASSSMSTDPQIWSLYLRMADHLLANLPDNTPVALEVFASHIERTLPPTLDRTRLRDELKGLEHIHQLTSSREQLTSLWEVLEAAPKLLGTPEFGDVVLALTDAGNSYGKATFHSAEEALRSNGIRLFWFLIEAPPGHTPEEVVGRPDFEDLVSDTGGVEVKMLASKLNPRFPFVDQSGRETEAGIQLQRQYQMMLNIYRLEIRFPTPLKKGARWKLEINAPSKRKVDILYPAKLADCPASSPIH